MVSSLEARQIFEKLKEDPENNKCIECDRENPTFASINNGCLMCPVCVQSHTALGVQISRIKSISGDWTLEDLKLMTAGGNSSLKVFFDHYNITNTPPNFKYLTRASFFYREMLAVVAQDQEYQHNCPGIDEGIQLVATSYPELPIFVEEAKVEPSQTPEKKNAWAWAKSAYAKTVAVGNKAAIKVEQKLNKFSEKPGVKKFEDKTMEIAGRLENGMQKLINKIKNKPVVQDTLSQVDHAADSFAKQATYTYNTINANPSVQKLKADTMNVLREIGNKIKKTFESENPKAPNEPYVAQV